MWVSEIRNQVALMVLSVAVAAIPSRIAAQDSPGEVTPRAMADSTYAVRITVDALADGIRRGRLDPRQVDDPQLAAAVGRLASAGAKRSRRPPQAALGALWDFQIDSLTFQPQGRDVLRALAQVYLATVPESARPTVTLTFVRREIPAIAPTPKRERYSWAG